jgi:prepilin-type N-terminal cleavage/methylation domain-containing protein
MPPLTTRKKSQTGFTFIETLIAVAILAVLVTGFLSFFVSCLFSNHGSRNMTIAKSHAQYAMETVKSTAFDLIASDSWDAAAIAARSLTALPEETINIAVNGSEIKDVAVTVNWKDHKTRARNYILETLIANP